jgi:hypothetical protein
MPIALGLSGLAAKSVPATAISSGAAASGSTLQADGAGGASFQPAGAGALTLLQTITLGADGTIDFTSISQAYNDLYLVGMLRGTNAAATDTLELHVNNDAGANYQYEQANAAATAWTVFGGAGSTVVDLLDNSLPAASANASFFASVELNVYGYTSTTWRKLVMMTSVLPNGTNGAIGLTAGVWASTAAVSRLTLFGGFTANLKAGSSMRLYGRT